MIANRGTEGSQVANVTVDRALRGARHSYPLIGQSVAVTDCTLIDPGMGRQRPTAVHHHRWPDHSARPSGFSAERIRTVLSSTAVEPALFQARRAGATP